MTFILLLQSHGRMLRLPSTQNQNIAVLHSYWLSKGEMSDLTNSTLDGRAKQVYVIQSHSPTMKKRRGSCTQSGSGGCFSMASVAEGANGSGIYWIHDSILTFFRIFVR